MGITVLGRIKGRERNGKKRCGGAWVPPRLKYHTSTWASLGDMTTMAKHCARERATFNRRISRTEDGGASVIAMIVVMVMVVIVVTVVVV